MIPEAHVRIEPDGLDDQFRIRICTGSGCSMNGAHDVADTFERELKAAGIDDQYKVVRTGCHGMCQEGPVVVVDPEGVFYPRVRQSGAKRIAEALAAGAEPLSDLLYVEPATGEHVVHYTDLAFNAKQVRIVLRNCGHIDPEHIDEYIERHGYEALRDVLTAGEPEAVIETILASGLRGRGGAGFATGQKWRFARNAPGDQKYMVCNADEGDPGAFMDRSILESDPHSVLEGMTIAAYAIGATEGYIYVRAEYPLAVRRAGIAIKQAEERGLLGDNICGSDFSFRLHVKEGAGAFVCGEETALMASVEGRRGMPRMRPPFPAISGLWKQPTNINNVETLANVAWIMRHGADAYASIGNGTSRGTKVFALTGKVRRTGLVEVPMGMTLRELIYDVGGGIKDDRPFRAVQMGGPSGGCLPEALLDTPIEYESLIAAGAIVGSGGVLVTDDRSCMVDLARFFLSFTRQESCGKCSPCRIGTKRMLDIVERITSGKGEEGDVELLERLARHISSASLCGLGQTAPNPVLTTLRYFHDEYDEHINGGRCRAGACTELQTYSVDPELCTGCLACRKNCPVGAISGKAKEPVVIDKDRCMKCGACISTCRFGAIRRS